MRMQRYKKIKVIISGGGTGGHVFPAISIANALHQKIQEAEILFVGAKKKLEMKKVPEAGFKIIGLNIAGFQRGFYWKNLLLPFKIIDSLIKAKKIINEFNPDVVVGVGGYASGPILKIATAKKIPTVIQEQNSYPGITNRMLAAKVDKICVAHNGMDKYFPKDKIYLTGNPVRKDVVDLDGKRNAALTYFKLKPDRQTVLIVGGSLGAKSINEAIYGNLEMLVNNNIQLIWQTGRLFFAKASSLTLKYEQVKVYDFINHMDMAYAAADVVVSRAGAIAISEISAVKKPAIFVPSPNVAEDHQTKNALSLVNYKAALLVNDNNANNELGETIVNLVNDKHLQEKLIKNISGLGFLNAADRIAELIINTSKNNQ